LQVGVTDKQVTVDRDLIEEAIATEQAGAGIDQTRRGDGIARPRVCQKPKWVGLQITGEGPNCIAQRARPEQR
jgi:hypothetical protein